jgi:hypothetical protein
MRLGRQPRRKQHAGRFRPGGCKGRFELANGLALKPHVRFAPASVSLSAVRLTQELQAHRRVVPCAASPLRRHRGGPETIGQALFACFPQQLDAGTAAPAARRVPLFRHLPGPLPRAESGKHMLRDGMRPFC